MRKDDRKSARQQAEVDPEESEESLVELAEIAERYDLEFVALFGSSARDGQGRDLDLAVMPRDPLTDFEGRQDLYGDLSEALAPREVDLVWLPNCSWLLSWQVARDGQALYQAQPGEFEQFQAAAYWRRVDSANWRGLEQEYLRNFLRKDLGMDTELIQRKLLQMTTYLSELEFVLTHPAAEFETNPLLLRTAERDTELLVECAARINTAIGQSRGVPPSDYYSSFFALVPDWLDRETATELAGAARLRNVLIHQYEDIRPDQVYSSAKRTVGLWRVYLESVSQRL